jgi:1,4-alpha-glucan branching enzyme
MFGLGAPEHLTPLATDAGPILWPIDRQMMSLVWSDRGYPAQGAYRDSHKLTRHHHRVWSNGGDAYDHGSALALAREHARDFVARAKTRIAGGGVSVCALDTELLGHWWYEGVEWLAAVIDEAARANLALTTLDDAMSRHEPVDRLGDCGITTWGDGGDLRTWSAPAVAELAWQARSAELQLLASDRKPPPRALRELLALQASDWAFLASRGTAGEYPVERARGHLHEFERALDGSAPDELRNLAPDLVGWG